MLSNQKRKLLITEKIHHVIHRVETYVTNMEVLIAEPLESLMADCMEDN